MYKISEETKRGMHATPEELGKQLEGLPDDITRCSRIACEDADKLIKVMQRAADRRVRRQADDFVTMIMERHCQ